MTGTVDSGPGSRFVQQSELEQLQRLSDATAALLAASTPEEVAAVTLRQGMRVVGADEGFIGRVDESEDVLHVIRLDASGGGHEQFQVPLDAPYPLADAFREGHEIFIRDNEDLSCNHPGLRRLKADDHACATVPLYDGDRLVGSLNFGYEVPHDFSQAERELIGVIAGRCAQALVRAERHMEEVAARKRAEDRLVELRALEVNDDVVQELAVAKLAYELGRDAEGFGAMERALEASKAIVARWSVHAETLRRDS